jgi:hypothetical protein
VDDKDEEKGLEESEANEPTELIWVWASKNYPMEI